MLRIFNVKQGDQFSFTVTFKNLQEDLTTFVMGVKEDYNDETRLVTKSLGNGITKIQTGKYRVDFTPEETQALSPNFYVYDLRLSIGTTVFTPLYGYLNIQETVFE
jgi:hypothetical protein